MAPRTGSSGGPRVIGSELTVNEDEPQTQHDDATETRHPCELCQYGAYRRLDGPANNDGDRHRSKSLSEASSSKRVTPCQPPCDEEGWNRQWRPRASQDENDDPRPS